MTRKKLRAQRALQTCQRYFARLNGKRPSRKMIVLADTCGFSADRDVPVARRTHKKRTPAAKGFKARMRFFNERLKGKWLSPRDFIQKPYFDEKTCRPSGYTEYLTEDDRIFYIAIDRKARYAHLQSARPFDIMNVSNDHAEKKVIDLNERRVTRLREGEDRVERTAA